MQCKDAAARLLRLHHAQAVKLNMTGAAISRWTMGYFAIATAWLLGAEAMMVAGFGYPSADLASPDTFVLVHMISIGWLSMAVCGALLQFVPVLVSRPLFAESWALPALILLTAGLIILLSGFLALGGHLPPWLWLLPIGACLFIIGFGLIAADVALTVWGAHSLGGPARFVLVGIASLCATVALGATFVSRLAGYGGAAIDSLLEFGVPLHAIAGLGGWLTLTAMGVSYRLLSMFLLSPDVHDRHVCMTLMAGALAIIVTVVGGSTAIGLASGLNAVLSVAGALGLVSAALYGRDIAHIFRGRKRRRLELNMRMALLSFTSLAATVLLGIALAGADAFAAHVGAFAFLGVFGWLSGLVLAKLYKIVAFLTWLETYGPVMGRVPTPRVQDLVAEGRATKWFVIYYVAVWTGTWMLLIGAPSAFRLAVAVMSIGVAGIVREVIRIRRLADVATPLRLPRGAVAPCLLLAETRRGKS